MKTYCITLLDGTERKVSGIHIFKALASAKLTRSDITNWYQIK